VESPLAPPEEPPTLVSPLLPPTDPDVEPPLDPPVVSAEADAPLLPEADPPALPPELAFDAGDESRGSRVFPLALASFFGSSVLGATSVPAKISLSRAGMGSSALLPAAGGESSRVSVPARDWKDGPESMPPEIIQPTRSPARILRAMADPTVVMPTRDPGAVVRYI
jgi:hypothetical protein